MFLSAASLNVDKSEVKVHVYINHAEQQTEFRRLVWTIMEMWVPGTSLQNGLVLDY